MDVEFDKYCYKTRLLIKLPIISRFNFFEVIYLSKMLGSDSLSLLQI